MGDVIHTICYVAEVESADESHCPHCLGTTIQTVEQEENVYPTVYPAEVFVTDANLASYQFDDGPVTVAPAEYSADMKVQIPVPPESFTHLCLRYNREGGARINVVAVNRQLGFKLRPDDILTNGLDPAFPIEAATIGDVDVDPATFHWGDTQPVIILDQHPGAFTIGPNDPAGDLWLKAYDTLSWNGQTLKFVSWERNRLSPWVIGTEHQWLSKGDTTSFLADTYVGVIAYYEPAKILDTHPNIPDTKPGDGSLDQPALRTIVLSWLAVVHYLDRLREGIFHPSRHAPDRDDHGVDLLAREIAPHERARLMTLAKASDVTHDELTAYLQELHERYD